MTKKKNKVGGIKRGGKTSQIERASSVSDVDQVQKAGGVTGVSGIKGSKRRPTRTMTVAEREKLFGMIKEEADKLFKESGMSAEEKEVIENAVKMAVDSGLANGEDGTSGSDDSGEEEESS